MMYWNHRHAPSTYCSFRTDKMHEKPLGLFSQLEVLVVYVEVTLILCGLVSLAFCPQNRLNMRQLVCCLFMVDFIAF